MCDAALLKRDGGTNLAEITSAIGCHAVLEAAPGYAACELTADAAGAAAADSVASASPRSLRG